MAMNHQLCMAHSVHKSHGHFKQRVSGFKSQGGEGQALRLGP